jgi:hypothetical protein
MIDWALVLGSCEGTLELWRAVTRLETAGRARGTMLGRRRAAPTTARGSAHACSIGNRLNWPHATRIGLTDSTFR